MKVRFVLCHANDDLSGEERNVLLSDHLVSIGIDSQIFGVFRCHESIEKRHESYLSKIIIFPVNDHMASVHEMRSIALLDQLESDKPDLIIIKGIDYALAAEIFERMPNTNIGCIIGGVSAHPFLDICKIVWFETSRQLDDYNGTAETWILPKMIPWHIVPEPTKSLKSFDIVNIGNFDEHRKSQYLLLPFTLKYKTLFIGGGRMLELYQSICDENSDAYFTGYVQRDDLFEKLSQAKLMVHCSMWDGYPRAVAESLACGIPVIGLKGVLDGIAPEPIVQCVDVYSLYSRVEEMLKDEITLKQIGQQARNFMQNTCSISNLKYVFEKSILTLFQK